MELEIADGVENPLPGIEEFREFQAGLKEWPAGSGCARIGPGADPPTE
ncbi:hypothetical protein ACIP79_04900 [Streptomyces sp. NPDC088747]